MKDHTNNPHQQYAKNEQRDAWLAELAVVEGIKKSDQEALTKVHHATKEAKRLRLAIQEEETKIAQFQEGLKTFPALQQSYSAKWLVFEITADLDDDIEHYQKQIDGLMGEFAKTSDKGYWLRRYSDDIVTAEYKMKWCMQIRKAIKEDSTLQDIIEIVRWGVEAFARSEMSQRCRDVLTARPGEQMVLGAELIALNDITGHDFGFMYQYMWHYVLATNENVLIDYAA